MICGSPIPNVNRLSPIKDKILCNVDIYSIEYIFRVNIFFT